MAALYRREPGGGAEGGGGLPGSNNSLPPAMGAGSISPPSIPGGRSAVPKSTNGAAASTWENVIRNATGGAAATANASKAASPKEFVDRVWSHAVEASRSTGIPPHFLVAQAALESGWGKSEIRRADGSSSFNLFGVKAGKNWDGGVVEVATTEYVGGRAIRANEKFRSYGSYAEAFQDYANLLRSNPRYGNVMGSQSGTEFAKRLQQAGYATDPAYADKLARIINGPTLRQALIS